MKSITNDELRITEEAVKFANWILNNPNIERGSDFDSYVHHYIYFWTISGDNAYSTQELYNLWKDGKTNV